MRVRPWPCRFTATAASVFGAGTGLLILSKVWVADWRVPSAPALLCDDDGRVNVGFVKQLVGVSELRVASACASLPPDGPTSFAALSASLRAAPDGSEASAATSNEWSVRRNWAMRYAYPRPPRIGSMGARTNRGR